MSENLELQFAVRNLKSHDWQWLSTCHRHVGTEYASHYASQHGRRTVLTMNFVNTTWKTTGFAPQPLRSYAFRALVCLLLLTSYLPVFSLYAKQHWSTANLQGAYAHAPLAILLIAFLVWRQRGKLLEPVRDSLSPGGLLLLTVGVILKIYGDIQGYVVLQGMSLIPVLLGLLVLFHNENAIRALRFPILFLIFVIPLPGAAIDALTLPLVNVTTGLVAGILPMLNIDVVKTGQVLTVNAHGLTALHEIIMAPECSGIRSLVSLLALSSFFTNLQGQGFGHSAALMLLTIPLVILGNSIRVVLTVLMIVHVSPDTAENFFHWSSGVLVFAVTLLGLFVVDAILTRRFKTMASVK